MVFQKLVPLDNQILAHYLEYYSMFAAFVLPLEKHLFYDSPPVQLVLRFASVVHVAFAIGTNRLYNRLNDRVFSMDS